MNFSFSKTLIFVFTIALLFQSAVAADASIIVNIKNPNSSISLSDLNNFFIKKNRKWLNGEAVRFYDQREDNGNRKLFLKKYINKTSREIELYWIGEKIYTGNIAPIQVTSDSMMVAMVSRFPGGIGYVSKRYRLPKTVKYLEINKE